MTLVTSYDASDIFEALGSAGLQAAGLDAATPIWQSFFEKGVPSFSPAEIQQMTDVFQGVLDGQALQTWQDGIHSYATLIERYVKNPTAYTLTGYDMGLQILMDQAAGGASGYKRTKLYIAAASLNLMVLKLLSELNPNPGSLANIGDQATLVLQKLFDLQKDMFNSIGIESFAAFQQHVYAGAPVDASQPWAEYVGNNYTKNVLELLRVIKAHTPDSLSSFISPRIILRFFPFDDKSVTNIWTRTMRDMDNPLKFFKCSMITADGVPYIPVGDLAVMGQRAALGEGINWGEPSTVPYIAPYPLAHAGGGYNLGTAIIYNQYGVLFPIQGVWNDADSGATQNDVSVWSLKPMKVADDQMLPMGYYVTPSHDEPRQPRAEFYMLNSKDVVKAGDAPTNKFETQMVIQFKKNPSGRLLKDPVFGAYSICYMWGVQDDAQFNCLNTESLFGFPTDLI